jgi:hypothetical protein
MRAEDAAIGVGLIDDHVAQAAEELIPVGVVRQDAGMQHVWVGQYDAGILADGGAVLLRGVAVIDSRCQVPGIRSQAEGCQGGELVLGECLGGKDI